MRTDDFNYALPEALIAFHPSVDRDGGRLLVLEGDDMAHAQIRDLPRLLPKGTLLVVNDTKVIKARLKGRRPTGAELEVFLLRITATGAHRCEAVALLNACRPARLGDAILLGDIRVTVRTKGARGQVVLDVDASGAELEAHLKTHGEVPLPPYIRRAPEPEDEVRYQTVFAAHEGSVAAPTAGLHFTEALIDAIQAKGVEMAYVTLHVGLGTFSPVLSESLEDHEMEQEAYAISEETVSRIERAKAEGRRVVAVGTTVTRALEGAFAANSALVPGAGQTDLFITPGFRFNVIEGIMTNFHLPRSTLLCLVSALAGRERILMAYQEAMARRYRFYSYGDAMLILPVKI